MNENVLDEFSAENLPIVRRRKLLPILTNAVIGILVCIYSIFVNQPEGHPFTFSLEIFILMPYLVWLVRVRKKWQEAGV